ncbi:MAG: hypothetical protein ABSF52_04730 [Syntrophobacteraceae bacterium]|jgi:hypothetical protein
MQDFEIRLLNSGEVGISALTERAQAFSRLEPERTLMFKSLGDTSLVDYVDVAEAKGFTFAGRELLRR